MGSKSGRKRRGRERKLQRGKDGPPPPAGGRQEPVDPTGEPAAPTHGDPVDVSGAVEPVMEAGPEWAPLPVPPVEAPAAAAPGSAAGAPGQAPEEPEVSEASGGAAQLADPNVSVAYGARETLDAIRRLEAQIDGLVDWLGRFTARQDAGRRHRSDDCARRQALLVAAMLVLFLPIIAALALGARFGLL